MQHPRVDDALPTRAVDALGDPALADLLGRLLRERPDSAESLRTDVPERAGRDEEPARLDAELARLDAAGLIRFRDGMIDVAAPSVTLSAAMLGHLSAQQAVLDELRALIEHLPPLDQRWAEGADRCVRGIEGEIVVGTPAATDHQVRLLAADPPEQGGWMLPSFESMRSFLVPVLEQLPARPPFRLVLNSAELDDTGYRALIDELIEGGAEVRLLPVVPQLLYVDPVRHAAIPITRDCRAPGGAVFFENRAVVEAFAASFDAWCHAARPYRPSREGWASVLELMAEGLMDRQIAAVLGVGVRTVHRRIADAMDELGAGSRFELGIAWAQRTSDAAAPREGNAPSPPAA